MEAASEEHLPCPLKVQWPGGDHGSHNTVLKAREEIDEFANPSLNFPVFQYLDL